jgi:hypothetical protein
MQGTTAATCTVLAGGATLTGYTPSQVAPLTVAPPAVPDSVRLTVLKGGYWGAEWEFFAKGGYCGNFY